MKKVSVVLLGLLLFGAGILFAADNRPIRVFDSVTGGLTVLERKSAETFDMYVQLLPCVEPPHHASDGCHPEGGARRVIAEIIARKLLCKEGR